jgi:tetratricopeptide (TPR) repeat protein
MLQQLRDREVQANEHYWAEQIDIQRRGASAWLALAEGRRADALAEMRAAAEAEDRTEKAAVTPGPIAPARELLGEMLLQMNEPAQALEAFEATLVKEPNRFRTEYGAGTAAKASGNDTLARKHYGRLLQICERADDPARPELSEARAFSTSSRAR